MGSMGTDEVRTSDGATCRSEVGGNTSVYVSGYGADQEYQYDRQDKGVSFGIVHRFGTGAKRIDCSKLYDKELTMKDLEIERMKAEIDQLRRMNNLNQGVQSGLIPPPPLG